MAMPKNQFAPSRLQLTMIVMALIAGLAIAGASYFITRGTQGPGGTGTALVGGPFTLTDQNGHKVTEKDFLGRYMLVYFGYTYCPDVCPTELQVISAALEQMGTKAADIQPIFITVDPQRDTPSILKQYVSNFHSRLIGLTGTSEEIAAVAKVYRVYYSKMDSKNAADQYLMDHTSIIYLMNRQGMFLKHFTYSTDSTELARALEKAMSL